MDESKKHLRPKSDLEAFLGDYRRIAAWATSGTVPFAAALINAAPPWPPAIVPCTAIVELIALLTAYTLCKGQTRRLVRRTLSLSAAALTVLSVSYLVDLSAMTYVIPGRSDRLSKGFECTAGARRLYAADCPLLNLADLAEGSFTPDTFWTGWSLAIARSLLSSLWFGSFCALSVCVTCVLELSSKPLLPSGDAVSLKDS